MAIRRPPTTFSDTISTADIADDAITGGKLANDIAISTTGNIATTGSGTLAIAGTSTLTGALTASGGIANAGTITAGTLGSSVVLGLVNHFRPIENFGHDTANTDVTLTLSNNKTYIAFCDGFSDTGGYHYNRAMLFTVNGSGAVTTHLNDDNVDPNIPRLKSTGTNQIVISSNHNSYRLTGVLFEMT